jgi:hypothetical protein
MLEVIASSEQVRRPQSQIFRDVKEAARPEHQ